MPADLLHMEVPIFTLKLNSAFLSLGNSREYNHRCLHRNPEVEEVVAVAAQVVESKAVRAVVAAVATTRIN